MPTAVPQPTYGPLGFVAPAEPDVLAGVQVDINGAFGGGLNQKLSTPQGQLASSEAAIIGNVNDLFVWLTNQFNPYYAEGRWQDGLAAIYFIDRRPATPTVVQAVCTGAEGTAIPVGAVAQSADGNLYVATQGGAIGPGGTVTLQFVCATPGAIACPSGALATIYQAIPGWDSITNPDDGTLGQPSESRTDFETRRFASVAKNGAGALPAVRGAVLAVEGLTDAYVTENPTGAPVVVNGFSVAAHSLYVAAVGGTDQDIADAIWTKKSPGCDTNGATVVTVYDTNYPPPYPSYTIKFVRPDPIPVLFKVTLKNSAQVPANVSDLVKTAIVSAFAGNDGGPRAQIGSELLASRYYAPVAALGPWAQIVSILIGGQNTAAAQFTASIAGTVMTVTAVASGTLAVGQTVVDEQAGILPGTTIASFGSGSGGTGTYNLSTSQTVASRTMFGALANQTTEQIQIDQVPTLSQDDIAVVLT